jgi:hypothetical protein
VAPRSGCVRSCYHGKYGRIGHNQIPVGRTYRRMPPPTPFVCPAQHKLDEALAKAKEALAIRQAALGPRWVGG